MPGNKITTQQGKLYMKYRKEGYSQTISAAKAGFSERSARNLESRGKRSKIEISEKGLLKEKQSMQSKKDPLENIWEEELVPLLEEVPHLTSWTLLEHIQDKYPDKYPDNIIRTMQRRTSKWRALYGPEKDIMFRQIHEPGQRGLSDFTELKGIEITIAGEVFDHILYHFRLAYSNWSHMKVIQGGESFAALSSGLQDALWKLGATPAEHRTDSLSAAFKNLSQDEREDITRSYKEVCDHYGIEATRNNRGKGHENGSVESAHGHLKRRIEQALFLRGSYEFDSISSYQEFIESVVKRHNHRHQPRLHIERAHLKPLPSKRSIDYTDTTARVTSSSTISVKKIIYSVPSRLIGHQLSIHIHDDRLSCYLGGDNVLNLPRIRSSKIKKDGVSRCINYRHLIHSLAKKPGAFRSSILRDDMLPSETYKSIWKFIDEYCSISHSNKLMVGILKLAADNDCEETLGEFVLSSLAKGVVPCLGTLQTKYSTKTGKKSLLPDLGVTQHSLEDYNNLLSTMMMEVGHA